MTAYELLTSGGSGTGISHYKSASFCGKKAQLNKLSFTEGYPLPTPSEKGKSPNALVVGSVFHWLREVKEETHAAK